MNTAGKIAFLSSFLLLASACGTYPFSMQKDLKKANNEVASSNAENQNLATQNKQIGAELQDVYASDNYIWVNMDVGIVGYSQAVSQCQAIGYQLPNQTAMNEFLSEVYNKHPEWASTAETPSTLHISGVTTGLQQGFVVCEKSRS